MGADESYKARDLDGNYLEIKRWEPQKALVFTFMQPEADGGDELEFEMHDGRAIELRDWLLKHFPLEAK